MLLHEVYIVLGIVGILHDFVLGKRAPKELVNIFFYLANLPSFAMRRSFFALSRYGTYHGDAHVYTTRKLRSQQVAVLRLVPENW